MIKHIGLTFGFAEEQHLGLVVFSHFKGFSTAREALENLASELYTKHKKYLTPVKKHFMECCEKENPSANYCSKCGAWLGKTPNLDIYTYEILLRSVPTRTNDTFGYDDLEWEIANTFSEIIKFKKKEILDIPFYAERALIAALPDKLVPANSLEILQKYRLETYFDENVKKLLEIPIGKTL